MTHQQPPTAYVDLHFRAYPEGDQWVSECIELGVTSCGDNMQDALAAILDATTVYLTAVEDEGELEHVLGEAGLQRVMSDAPEPEARIAVRLPVSAGLR